MLSFFTKFTVSLTKHCQNVMLSRNVSITLFSSSVINVPAKTGPNGDPKATLSIC